MKRRLTRVAPLRTGVVLGILYGIGGLIAAPFFLIAAVLGSHGAASGVVGGVAFAALLPIMYAVMGFLSGVIGAALYNLVVKWTGGLEFEVSDDAVA
jgi:hypothetical protein